MNSTTAFIETTEFILVGAVLYESGPGGQFLAGTFMDFLTPMANEIPRMREQRLPSSRILELLGVIEPDPAPVA